MCIATRDIRSIIKKKCFDRYIYILHSKIEMCSDLMNRKHLDKNRRYILFLYIAKEGSNNSSKRLCPTNIYASNDEMIMWKT